MKLHPVALALAMSFSSAPAFAKDPPKAATKDAHSPAAGKKPADEKAAAQEAAMMAAWQKFATPGEQQAWLQKMMAGSWTTSNKMWMGPGDPTSSTGTAEVKTILGDRYIEEEHTGTFMGKPFHGKGVTGYDNAKKKFVSVWVDTMGTGIMISEGALAADGKTLNTVATSTNPMNGEPETTRVVDHFEGNKRVSEFYSKGPDGKEVKMMEITYTRK